MLLTVHLLQNPTKGFGLKQIDILMIFGIKENHYR